MTGFQWLNDLAHWVARWVPRLTLVPPTHCGVRFGHRGTATDVGKGLVVWWPLIHDLKQIPVVTRSIHISARCMGQADIAASLPTNVICGLAVQYKVVDARKAAISIVDLNALVDNRCQAALGEMWASSSGRAHKAAGEAFQILVPELKERFGILLERLDVTNTGVAVGLMQLSDWGFFDHDTDSQSPLQ